LTWQRSVLCFFFFLSTTHTWVWVWKWNCRCNCFVAVHKNRFCSCILIVNMNSQKNFFHAFRNYLFLKKNAFRWFFFYIFNHQTHCHDVCMRHTVCWFLLQHLSHWRVKTPPPFSPNIYEVNASKIQDLGPKNGYIFGGFFGTPPPLSGVVRSPLSKFLDPLLYLTDWLHE
jgi:hypothetical protein